MNCIGTYQGYQIVESIMSHGTMGPKSSNQKFKWLCLIVQRENKNYVKDMNTHLCLSMAPSIWVTVRGKEILILCKHKKKISNLVTRVLNHPGQ